MRTLRLKARCWIGMEILALIQSKAVARAGRDGGFTGKIAPGFRGQRLKSPRPFWIGIFFEHDVDPASFRSPDAKVRPTGCDHFGADRITALSYSQVHALNSPIGRDAVALQCKIEFR